MTAASAAAGPDRSAPLSFALTMGDPAGIGPDITLAAWRARGAHALPAFAVYGDPDVLAQRASQLGYDTSFVTVDDAREAAAHFAKCVPVVPVPVASPVVAGRPNVANAAAVIGAIDRAVADVAKGTADGLVTNPIAKSVLYQAGFSAPGHTEYLGGLARKHWPGTKARSVMMLASDDLRVVPLTIHVPLRDVSKLVTFELICETARTLADALKNDFGIAQPRIAVAGLNPHAGEAGSLGTEDRDVIAPAIASLAAAGLTITGPHSADTLFHAAARQTYDAVLTMYHDQALIPIKTLAFDTGVNITLGLPFVRTSPDHGTAFGIAGSGNASAASLIAALKLAGIIARQRTASRQAAP